MIKVLSSGLYTTIQDLGRFGFRKYGVPVSGAMDQYSAKLANQLVGNNPHLPVLEITLIGPTLQFTNNAYVALTGADLSPTINDQPVSLNTGIAMPAGTVLHFGKQQYGTRCYLAISGGFSSSLVMESYSFYPGITATTKIKKGDQISVLSENDFAEVTHASVKVSNLHFTSEEISVFPGPEYHLLHKSDQKKLENTFFSISPDSNRMAYVLDTEIHLSLAEIITAPVQPGTVQLTPSGKLIILMRDAQTTGGYARILQVTENTINRLAQKRASNTIKFKLLS